MQKKRKSYWSVSEIGPSPPLKFDADADANAADADDDGRVGIWKAPLPGGTAELKIHMYMQTTNHTGFGTVTLESQDSVDLLGVPQLWTC